MKKYKLKGNRIESLVWGLHNFDGIETDIRLNKDREIVIYHNTKHKRKAVSKMSTAECEAENIWLLQDFLSQPEVSKANSLGKDFIFEFKPDCDWYRECTLGDNFRDALFNAFDDSNFRIGKNVHFMSFSDKLLQAFREHPINLYPIYPLSNFCVYKNRWSLFLMKTMRFMFKYSTIELLKKLLEQNYRGACVSFPYFYGMNRIYGEKREEIMNFIKENDLTIIGNFYFMRIEKNYENIMLLTDITHPYPRYSTRGGAIIAHKGGGAHGVKIPVHEYHSLLDKIDFYHYRPGSEIAPKTNSGNKKRYQLIDRIGS